MWCGVVWCGVVWCGVMWCGVMWCSVVWCGVVVGVSIMWWCVVLRDGFVVRYILNQNVVYFQYNTLHCKFEYCYSGINPIVFRSISDTRS